MDLKDLQKTKNFNHASSFDQSRDTKVLSG